MHQSQILIYLFSILAFCCFHASEAAPATHRLSRKSDGHKDHDRILPRTFSNEFEQSQEAADKYLRRGVRQFLYSEV